MFCYFPFHPFQFNTIGSILYHFILTLLPLTNIHPTAFLVRKEDETEKKKRRKNTHNVNVYMKISQKQQA